MAQVMTIAAKMPSGEQVNMSFPLHPHTKSIAAVAGLVESILDGIERDGRKFGHVYPSDVLQALAIAMATRALMIDAPVKQASELARELLAGAMVTAEDTHRRLKPTVGHA